jgi:hypothetical protein
VAKGVLRREKRGERRSNQCGAWSGEIENEDDHEDEDDLGRGESRREGLSIEANRTNY